MFIQASPIEAVTLIFMHKTKGKSWEKVSGRDIFT